jgi:hypothetical protein
MKMSNKSGFGFVRDTGLEPLVTTLAKAYEKYVKKVGEAPTEIECSIKDSKEEFQFEGVTVKPMRCWMPGNVWMSSKNVKRTEVTA